MAEKLEIKVKQKGAALTSTEFEKLKQKIGSVNNEAKTLSNSMDKAQKGMMGMRVSTSGLRRVIGKFRNELLLFTFATAGLTRALKEVIKEFAAFEQANNAIELSFNKMGEAVVSQLDAVAQGTVKSTDLIMAANRTMTLSVTTDVNKMATLLQFARIRARAMGITTAQAFDNLATGIGKQSPKILDNLGLIIKGWGAEAEAAGKAYDAQFVLNKVLEQANEEIKNTGELSLTTADRMSQLSASWGNLKIAIGEALTEKNATWFTELADAIAYLTKEIKGESQVFMSAAEIVANMSQDNVWAIEAEIRKRREMVASTKEYQKSVRDQIAFNERMIAQYRAGAKEEKRGSDLRAKYLELVHRLRKETATLYVESESFSQDQIVAWGNQADALEEYVRLLERAYATMKPITPDFDKIGEAPKFVDTFSNETAKRMKETVKESEEYWENSTDGWLDNFTQTFEETMNNTAERWKAWSMMFSDTFYTLFTGSGDDIAEYLNNLWKRMAADLAASALINLLNPAAGGVGMFGAQGLFGFLGLKNGGSVSNRGGRPVKAQTGYSGIVPPGYPNDSFPIMVQSGERVDVTSAGNTRNGFSGMVDAINTLTKVVQGKPVAQTQTIGEATLFRTVQRGSRKSGSLWTS